MTTTETALHATEPTITMTRVYDAPRALVWRCMTEPEHVREWWGGPGFTNPVCSMDLRPGGAWHHVMRFPDGFELEMRFVFEEVEPPARLVWRHADPAPRAGGPPTCVTSVTLDELGPRRTRWTMVARFRSHADRDAAVRMGFTKPIEASNERLTAYLARAERA